MKSPPMTDPVADLKSALIAVQADFLPVFKAPFTFMPQSPGRNLIRWTPGKGFTVNRVALENLTQRELCFLAVNLAGVIKAGHRAVEAELQRVRAATDRAREILSVIRKASH